MSGDELAAAVDAAVDERAALHADADRRYDALVDQLQKGRAWMHYAIDQGWQYVPEVPQ